MVAPVRARGLRCGADGIGERQHPPIRRIHGERGTVLEVAVDQPELVVVPVPASVELNP